MVTTSLQRTVLLLAFHFPPIKGSSGLERTLGFCRHLPRFGWKPLVVSAHPRAYEAVSNERMSDIPDAVVVKRAFALDTARHLAMGGRYPGWAALPDRWVSWLFGAVPVAWLAVRRHRPTAIWSTYPIATAHIAGEWISRLTGLPWVADFRDPMVEYDDRTRTHFPTDARLRAVRLRIEARAARRAAALVFCSPGAAAIFAARYPEVGTERIHVIPNGYDEDAFRSLPAPTATATPRPLTLVHSGVLYPGPDRDPTAFLCAVRGLLDAEPRWRGRLRVVLRASGFDAIYRETIARLDLGSHVELLPPMIYREALAEMRSADGLLVFQGHTSNPAIPAKLYEYFRAGRPILAMVDDEGDTAALLRKEAAGVLAPLDDVPRIQSALSAFLVGVESGTIAVMSAARAASFERGVRSAELAALLDRLVADTAVGVQGTEG